MWHRNLSFAIIISSNGKNVLDRNCIYPIPFILSVKETMIYNAAVESSGNPSETN